jgi:hypothetical protein
MNFYILSRLRHLNYIASLEKKCNLQKSISVYMLLIKKIQK